MVCSKKLHILAKSTIFHNFSRNEPLFVSFCLKDDLFPKQGGLLENVANCGEIDDFSCFFEK